MHFYLEACIRKYKQASLIFSSTVYIRKNVTTRPQKSQIICTTCTIILLFAQLMFFAPLLSITPGISMRSCREEILSPNQPFPSLYYRRYLIHEYDYRRT